MPEQFLGDDVLDRKVDLCENCERMVDAILPVFE